MQATILSVLLFSSLLIAQTTAQTGRPGSSQSPPRPPQAHVAQGSGEALPDNYQLTLTLSDKDNPREVSVVVASRQFATQISDPPALVFSGTLTLEDGGALVVAYVLNWETVILNGTSTQFKPSSTQGSVRLKPGEEIQILRAGNLSARLSIKQLEASKPK
jgi:hypothetical protein